MLKIIVFALFLHYISAFSLDFSINTHHPLNGLFFSIGNMSPAIPGGGTISVFIKVNEFGRVQQKWGDLESLVVFDMDSGITTYDFEIYVSRDSVLMYHTAVSYDIAQDCKRMGFASENCFFGNLTVDDSPTDSPTEAAVFDDETPQTTLPCQNIHATIVADNMPRFPDDHSVVATLLIDSKENMGLFRWIVSVNGQRPMLWSPSDSPYTFKLAANTDYSAVVTVSRKIEGYPDTVSDFICTATTQVLKALPPLSIRFIAPVQPFNCGDFLLFRVAIVNKFATPIPTPTTTKRLAAVKRVSEFEYILENGMLYDDLDIQFDFGETRIVMTDITRIVQGGLMAPALVFDVAYTPDSESTSPLACSADSYSPDGIVVTNTGPLPTKYTTSSQTTESIPQMNTIPYGGSATKIYETVVVWNGVCPNVTLFVPARYHIALEVNVTDDMQIHVANDIPELSVRHAINNTLYTVVSSIYYTLSMEYTGCQITNSLLVDYTKYPPQMHIDGVQLRGSHHEISVSTADAASCYVASEPPSSKSKGRKSHVLYVNEMGTYVVVCRSAWGVEAQKLVHVGRDLADNSQLMQSDAMNTTRFLKCPVAMHPGGAINYEYIKANWIGDSVSDIIVWNEATFESTSLNLERPIYMARNVGTYVFDVIDNATKTHYFSSTLPFVLSEPALSADDFVSKIAKYPSCDDLSDGVVVLHFPKGIAIDIVVVSCASCVVHVQPEIDIDVEMGMATIGNLPYFEAMVLEVSILDTPCRFDKPIEMPRQRETVVAQLLYTPTCNTNDHTVIALDRFGNQMHPDKYAMTFSWGESSAWTVPRDQVVSGATVVAYLEVSVSPTCKSNATLKFTALRPPVVTVSHAESLPVFCPNASDAKLVARSNIARGSSVVWTDENNNIVRDPSKVPGGHTYTATVRTGTCVTSDSIYVAPKTRYQMDYHTSIVYGSANLASIVIDGVHAPEVQRFVGEMLKSEDRVFLHDTADGSGDSSLNNIPEGRVLDILIPYPDAYAAQQAHLGFCDTPWRVNIGEPAVVATYSAMVRKHATLEQSIYDYPHDILAKAQYEMRTNTLMDQTTLVERYMARDGEVRAEIVYHMIAAPETLKVRRSVNADEIKIVIQASSLPPPHPDVAGTTSLSTSALYVTVYVHGVDDPSEYVVENELGEAFYLRESTLDYWTYVIRDIALAKNSRNELELVYAGAEKRTANTMQQQQQQQRISVQTFPVTPLSVSCIVVLEPSSVYSLDGKIRVSIGGGQAPFVVEWSDDPNVATLTNSSVVNRNGLGVGIYGVTVIDSAFGAENAAKCSVNMHATSDFGFRIVSLTTDTPTGCAPYVEMVIHASVADGTAALVAAWNTLSESAITSCSDGRMGVVANALDITTTVYGSGRWRVAICSTTNLLVTSNGQDQYIESTTNNTFPLAIANATLGETCTEPSDNSTLTTKTPVTLVITYPTGSISIYREGSVPVTGTLAVDGNSSVASIYGLATGMHTLTVYDERLCASFVDVMVNNTGLEICGTCNRSDTFCQDQCKLPYGNNTCLYDCIIDGLDAMKDANQSSILFETTYCLDRGRRLVGNIENDLSDAYARANVTSKAWTANKTLDSLIFGDSTAFVLNTELVIFESCAFVGKNALANVNTAEFYDCGSYADSRVTVTVAAFSNVTIRVLNGSQLGTVSLRGPLRPDGFSFEFGADGSDHIEHAELQISFSRGSNVTNMTVICAMFAKYDNDEFGSISVNGGTAYTALMADDICASFGGIVTPKKTLADNVPAKSIIMAIVVVEFVMVLFGSIMSVKRVEMKI